MSASGRLAMDGTSEQSYSYWLYYDLNRDPFLDIEVSRAKGLSQWGPHFELLLHLIQYSNVLLAVTGQNENGKLTLVDQFAMKVSKIIETCIIQSKPNLDPIEFLESVCTHCGLSEIANSDHELAEKFTLLIEALAKSKRKVVVLFDNAQCLPSKTLETCFRLVRQQAEDHARLHIVLFGDALIESLLQTIAVSRNDESLLHSINLKPFSLEETEKYLRYCLSTAGLTTEFPFKARDIKQIHKESGGLLGPTNECARQWLSANAHKQRKPLLRFWKAYHLQLSSAGLVLAALFAFGLGYESTSSESTVDVSPTPAQVQNASPNITAAAPQSTLALPQPDSQDHLFKPTATAPQSNLPTLKYTPITKQIMAAAPQALPTTPPANAVRLAALEPGKRQVKTPAFIVPATTSNVIQYVPLERQYRGKNQATQHAPNTQAHTAPVTPKIEAKSALPVTQKTTVLPALPVTQKSTATLPAVPARNSTVMNDLPPLNKGNQPTLPAHTKVQTKPVNHSPAIATVAAPKTTVIQYVPNEKLEKSHAQPKSAKKSAKHVNAAVAKKQTVSSKKQADKKHTDKRHVEKKSAEKKHVSEQSIKKADVQISKSSTNKKRAPHKAVSNKKQVHGHKQSPVKKQHGIAKQPASSHQPILVEVKSAPVAPPEMIAQPPVEITAAETDAAPPLKIQSAHEEVKSSAPLVHHSAAAHIHATLPPKHLSLHDEMQPHPYSAAALTHADREKILAALHTAHKAPAHVVTATPAAPHVVVATHKPQAVAKPATPSPSPAAPVGLGVLALPTPTTQSAQADPATNPDQLDSYRAVPAKS